MEQFHNQSCPWATWQPATLHFCESQRCEWVSTPAEFWSNIPYFLIAAVLLRRGIREDNGPSSIPLRFGIYALIVGICSSAFHASHTFIFETFDLGAMLLLGVELIIQNLTRLRWIQPKSIPVWSGLIFFSGLFLLLETQGPARLWIFGTMVAIALFLQVLIFLEPKRSNQLAHATSLIQSLVLFGISYAFWLIDYTKAVCYPNNHYWSGHALWHCINSVCFLTLSNFYITLNSPSFDSA